MLQGDNSPKINSPDAATTTKTSHLHSGEKGNKDSVPGIHGNFIISELRGSQQGQAKSRQSPSRSRVLGQQEQLSSLFSPSQSF